MSNYMIDRNQEISVPGPLECESLIQSIYAAWDNAPEEVCPRCHGTGLDRYEEDECATCFGEGVLPPSVSDLPDLTAAPA